MFDSSLIESANLQKTRGAFVTQLISLVAHALVIGAIVYAGIYMKENPDALERPIEAFVVASAPPPPPPPPPARSSGAQESHPIVKQTPREQFVAPTDTAQHVPNVEVEKKESKGGVAGGVEGGVEGGVVGGEVGGVVGGTVGGVLGGQLGGTGDQALPIGGDVLPPKVISRVDPNYTEPARRSRVQGVVILEAIINRSGDITDVRVLRSLKPDLDEEAMLAVRKWKFLPGTRHGEPVPVIYMLTVKFSLQ